MVDAAWRTRKLVEPAVASRSKVLAKLRTKDAVFFQLTRGSAILVLDHPGRHHRFADHWSVASAGHVRVQFSDHGDLEPGHRGVRRRSTDLRHRGNLGHRHADCRADRASYRAVSDRAMPNVAAPAYRHCGRAVSRYPEHHIRHLGTVRVRAVPAAHRAAGTDQHYSAISRCFRPCSQAHLTASAS